MGLPSSGDPPGRRDHADRHPTRAALARRVRRWGRTSWALVGIALAIAIGYSAAAALSGLVVPSLFAVFAGVSLVPVLDWWVAKGLNRRLGALILILGLGSVVLLGGLVLLRGLVLEGDAIRITVVRAVGALHSWLDNGDPGRSSALVDAVASSAAPLLTGAAAWASAFFSVTLALAIGAFVAVFMLYYVLVDWAELREWVARHLGVPAELGSQIIEDATDVVRRGIGVLAILGVIDATLIALTMALLGLPFVLGVAVVLFLGCFVPYLGTFVAGTFAVLIALGGGGPGDAAVVLVVILVVEIVVRTLIGNWLASDRLALRPLPSIVSSVVGVAVAGLLGAVLSAPALALAIAVSRRVRAARTTIATEGS